MKKNNLTIDTEQNKKSDTNISVRINKYLALQNIATRRGADALIKSGLVFINGTVAILGDQVYKDDKVTLKQGDKVKKNYVYFAYNKPIGIETSSPREDLFPLGRLDKASHGLLILTNDGRITDKLLNPKYVHDKEYIVKTGNKLRSSFKGKMEAGVNIEGYKTKSCKVTVMNDFTFKVILTEGKKHQIRRMCSALFQEVADLKRTRIMNINLGTLKPNALREIKGKELETFLKAVLN